MRWNINLNTPTESHYVLQIKVSCQDIKDLFTQQIVYIHLSITSSRGYKIEGKTNYKKVVTCSSKRIINHVYFQIDHYSSYRI